MGGGGTKPNKSVFFSFVYGCGENLWLLFFFFLFDFFVIFSFLFFLLKWERLHSSNWTDRYLIIIAVTLQLQSALTTVLTAWWQSGRMSSVDDDDENPVKHIKI